MCKKRYSQKKEKEKRNKFGCSATITEDLALEMTIKSKTLYTYDDMKNMRVVLLKDCL